MKLLEQLKDARFWSQLLLLFAGVSIVLAEIGAFGVDIYLASTQWMLVGVFLAVLAVYVRCESCCRGK